MTNPTLQASSSVATIAGYARLLVPAVAGLLVVLALNASWHAIQSTLRALDASGELVVALPAVLEPAALIYAWVTIDRRRTGRHTGGAGWLLAAALAAAVVYNVASALPLDLLLPSGSVGRMAALAVSAALAPLTVVSVGHTALVEYAAWRASRRSLADDVHTALEAEAQQALTGQLRAEFAGEVQAAVLARLRAEMAARLGTTQLRAGGQPAVVVSPAGEQNGSPAIEGEQPCSPSIDAANTPAIGGQTPGSRDGASVLWERIAVEVTRLDSRPTQQAIADRLGVSRARVQRAIAANRDAWEQLTNGDGPPDPGG